MSKVQYGQLITEAQGGKSTCRSVIFDLPQKEDADDKTLPKNEGQIIGLIELEASPNKKTLAFLDALIGEIKMAAAGSFGKPSQKSLEELFENFIQKTNYRYLELAGNKSSLAATDEANGLPKINAVLALFDDKNLHLAQRGKVLPFLIYEVKPGNFRIMNVAEAATGKEARASKLSLFTNIVSGKIGANDNLFFTTESILDYFSLEKISKTVSATNPETATETLKNLLGEVANPETSFAFIIIKSRQEIPVIKAVSSPAPAPLLTDHISVPQHSMEGLLKTASDTEKMLTPSLGLNIGGEFFSFLGGFKSLFRKNEIKDNARLEYYSSQFHPPRGTKKFFRFLSLFFLAVLRIPYFLIKIILSFLFNLLKTIFYLITNWKGQRNGALKSAAENFGKSWSALWPKTEKIPSLSRALLIFAVIFVALFAGSTALLYYRYQNSLAAKALEQKVEVIQNKKSAIEASLIYNDETGAKVALAEADALLAEFPQKTKKEKDAYQNIFSEIETIREKLRHVVNVQNPVVVANFPGYSPDASVLKFIVANNNIYAFDRAASVIYKINLINNEAISKSISGLNFELVFTENGSSAFLYQPDKKFFKLDFTNDGLGELEVILNEKETDIKDLAVYNGKLYILDVKNNQIFKHLATAAGFAGGAAWLRDNIDLQNAKSIAIDGLIYVGKTDGKILKFSNGQQVDFTPEIDPALSSEIKIWTSADSSFIYVLEPSSKRLIILDKEGKLDTQYFSEKFDNLKDFAVVEKEKKLYLLSGDFIYEIAATHLK